MLCKILHAWHVYTLKQFKKRMERRRLKKLQKAQKLKEEAAQSAQPPKKDKKRKSAREGGAQPPVAVINLPKQVAQPPPKPSKTKSQANLKTGQVVQTASRQKQGGGHSSVIGRETKETAEKPLKDIKKLKKQASHQKLQGSKLASHSMILEPVANGLKGLKSRNARGAGGSRGCSSSRGAGSAGRQGSQHESQRGSKQPSLRNSRNPSRDIIKLQEKESVLLHATKSGFESSQNLGIRSINIQIKNRQFKPASPRPAPKLMKEKELVALRSTAMAALPPPKSPSLLSKYSNPAMNSKIS